MNKNDIENKVVVNKKTMNNKKIEITVIALVIVLQTIIFIIVGANKSYIHMDEAYSLGLASYDKVEIQNNEDFYNTWHDGDYYEDYLTVNDDEKGQYSQVYENQKNDVHPPFYYLLLRFCMGFNLNEYSKWSGIILNIVIYAFITIFMYLIVERLLKKQPHAKEKAAVIAFVSSIVMSSLNSVIYIRMYALSTLNILITTFLHMKLLEKEKVTPGILIAIGISALLGSLTHYYFLFYLAMLVLMFAIRYIRRKEYKNLGFYILTMAIAGGLSLAIFPYSIKHMFFGYRGQGFIDKLLNIPEFFKGIGGYLSKIQVYTFNNMFMIIVLVIIALAVHKRVKKQKIFNERNEYIKFILLPTTFYFILVAIASPWIELRYIMPICGLIFILVMYCLYKLLHSTFGEKASNIIMVIVLVIMLIIPFVLKLEPEVMYSDKREIVQKVENELNLPTIFMFDSGHNRFLDDILLFSKLDESYIAKDFEYTEGNIQKILEGKDISNGIVLFINEGQDNDKIIETVESATGLGTCTYVKRLNACDVYYVN